MRGCPGKLYTNLDATGVIRKSEHAEPVSEIYDELASNASNNLDTAVYFSSWDQARNTKYYSRAKRYPRLLARRQDLRLTAEQTTTKSDCPILVPAVVYPSCVHEGKTLPVVYCLTVRKDLFTGSWIFEVLHSKAGKNLVSKLIWHNLLVISK
ncbi:hypothetical protein T4B_4011 [Trichinella pseudospiralis]|uniref:Uncharacterized protein n=1 Tax=Trichinella pseudospiralis TaxID=6337 RepID=A0A0V1J8Q2_TRIPS|nr:hypothetical protein T4B_4011 [Trichinella pseudospiralis]